MPRLNDNLQAVLRRLAEGDRLVGPVQQHRPGRSPAVKPLKRRWGFASGERANAHSVDELIRRGLVERRGDEAVLVVRYDPVGRYRGGLPSHQTPGRSDR